MVDNRQFTALEWVISEIKDTLQEADRVLALYVEDTQDATQLRFCLTHIHQVYGSLHMINFHGAAMLAEEMEMLAKTIVEKRSKNPKEATGVLQGAIKELPNYLEKVQETKRDYPGVLLSLLNDIRAARGTSLLSESTLFTPNLNYAYRPQGEQRAISQDDGQLKPLLAKLLQMYQYAAASMLSDVNTEQSLNYISKVSERLKKVLQGTQRYAVWEIAYALIDGIQQGVVKPTVALKQLLRELNEELKYLAVQGTKALQAPTNEELLKNLLYYVSTTGEATPALEAVKANYEINHLMPLSQVTAEEPITSDVNDEVLDTVIQDIRRSFDTIKANLYAAEGPDESQIQLGLQKVIDTLAILGVGELRQKLNDIIIDISNQRRLGKNLDKAQLNVIDQQITEVESKLASTLSNNYQDLLPTFSFNEEEETLLDTCRNHLESAKDAIVDYIAAQWDAEKIQGVPQLLRECRGHFASLSLDKAVSTISSCIFYIDSKLIGENLRPQWSEVDNLVDVIARLDYYIEFLSTARENDETILTPAEEALSALGVTVAKVEPIRPNIDTAGSALPAPAEEEAVTEVSPEQAETPAVEEEEDDDDLIDPEVIEIFIEEAEEILERIDEYFPQWQNDPMNKDALTETRRAFHTLKGSGRMVGASDIGELAWSIENMMNRIIDNTVTVDQIHVQLVAQVRGILPEMIEAFKQKQANPQKANTDTFMEWGDLLSKSQQNDAMAAALLGTPEPEQEPEVPEIEVPVLTEDQPEINEEDFQLWQVFASEAESHLEVVNDFIARMKRQDPFFEPPSDPAQRALHTLKGSAYMAELTPIAEIVAPTEGFTKELRNYQIKINPDTLQMLEDCASLTQHALAQIKQRQFPQIEEADTYIARVKALREEIVAPLVRENKDTPESQQVDPAILELLMTEGMDLLLDADLKIDHWQQAGATEEEWQQMASELDTVSQAAERAKLPFMAKVCSSLQKCYETLISGQLAPNNDSYALMLDGHDALMDICDSIAASQDPPEDNEDLISRLNALSEQAAQTTEKGGSNIVAFHGVTPAEDTQAEELPSDQDSNLLDQPEVETTEADVNLESEETTESIDAPETYTLTEEPAPTDEVVEEENHNESQAEFTEQSDSSLAESQAQYEVETISETAATEDDTDSDLDTETAEIFYDEALELLEDLDNDIHEWEDGGDAKTHNESIQRTLHTFKGGARLAKLMGLGDIAHDFETYLIDLLLKGPKDELFTDIHGFQDQLVKEVDKIGVMLGFKDDTEAMVEPQSEVAEPETSTEPELETPSETSASEESTPEPGTKGKVLRFPERNLTPITTQSPLSDQVSVTGGGGQQAAARRNQPQEMVKVSSDLMENLVNLAGETSISRGRVEEQINELGFALEEMGSTVQRLQEQLRRLDIETEAQVIFRQEQMSDEEEFDPLEMDRYSQLQQLSRSLIESASDLLDLRATLADKTRDVETVLLEQSRINTDLQEGLMRSRMVPFSRIIPRLRRIVRQIATELNKEVTLELGNVEGELDKSMMEHMVAPLEHMLRNAIDHGIENTQERLDAGKPAEGKITIGLERDGGDVLIHVTDDGRGINVGKVKEKAIERNLLHPEADLSEQEILQYILYAGFSTAEEVTQISGRGVGMDVVNSEIKQMGGNIIISSVAGLGAAFTIRVPFTLSVNRALMISMGEDRYAVPLNTIEGIVRISPYELEYHYANPDDPFDYAGRQYDLRYLGSLLDINTKPKLQGQSLPLPVLLLRSSEHSVAIHVDSLLGSREIVVKSLGPQFKSVQGVSGATILGDGNVVIILDPNALVRQMIALDKPQILDTLSTHPIPPEDRTPVVMVVDDSVTVRKVTSRLLEREGYDVVTAKDGLDAMTQLQDDIPDLMLLDIEMPRMDGFEVAKNIRSSEQLKHLPIIMITSRTSDKHRQRGLESGANYYMGKPYQESQLLENIQELIAPEQNKDG